MDKIEDSPGLRGFSWVVRMWSLRNNNRLRLPFFVALLCLGLSACDSGNKTSNDSFFDQPTPPSNQPTLNAVNPNTGSFTGGATLTLSGSGFVAGATATVGTENCGSLNVVSSSIITCVLPANATGAALGSYAVTVTNVGGLSSSLPSSFTYAFQTMDLIVGSIDPRGANDGVSTEARFFSPSAITTDGTALFVTDTTNHMVRRILLSTGEVTTFAGTATSSGTTDGTGALARFSQPYGIVYLGGFLYVADLANHSIRRIDSTTGVVTTFLGTSGVQGSADGVGNAALFRNPRYLTTDGTNLYISDYGNHTIRKADIATRTVTTLAGTAGASGNTNGIGAAARFNQPTGMQYLAGFVYVADLANHRLRRVDASDGTVTTFAGTLAGYVDGVGVAARFRNPWDIATDGTYLYVTEYGNHTVRRVEVATATVSGLAGTALSFGTDDGIGAAARFNQPRGIGIDGGYLYVADATNHLIRRIDYASDTVTTLAGLPTPPRAFNSTDGTGTTGRVFQPRGMAVSGTTLYVADASNYIVRSLDLSTNTIAHLAGLAGNLGTADGIGSAARFNQPYAIAIHGTSLYVSDYNNHTIREVDIPTGEVFTIAGTAGVSGSADGAGLAATFNNPRGIATDGTNLYVVDQTNHTIRRIVIATGVVSTLAGAAGQTGSTNATGTAARFNSPTHIVYDSGELFVADMSNHRVRKIVVATGVVTTLAGSAAGYADGVGAAARFSNPIYLSTDGTHLYLVDSNNHAIRKIRKSDGTVTSLTQVVSGAVSKEIEGAIATATLRVPLAVEFVQSKGLIVTTDYGVFQIH